MFYRFGKGYEKRLSYNSYGKPLMDGKGKSNLSHSGDLVVLAVSDEMADVSDEAAAVGLSAKIMRVGNLSARDTDGEFQMNFATNSFVGRLKSYELIGKFPYSMMDMTAEMAPIDSTARAILTLAKTPKACCLFHPYNNHSIYLGDIICAMQGCGVEIELAEEADYLAALEAAQKDPDKAAVLSSMIAYENMGHGKKTVSIARTNDYTMQVLYRMGYQWPTTSKEYVGRFVEAMEGLGFFAGA